MNEKRSIVIFASGGGTNAENIILSFRKDNGPDIKAIFCNRPDAGVILRAKRLNVPVIIFGREELQNGAVLEELAEFKPDILVLAGFLWLMPPDIISAFPQGIVNIHPALLPTYGGKGMYGDKVHRAVIDAGEKESGITIHFVNERYDEGNIIFQTKCPVLADDSPEILAARIHELEYVHFPDQIRKLLS